MAERSVSGITIEEQSGPDQAILRAPTAVTAFVGRALKGPVNRPQEVRSFAEFVAIFGGLWQPAPLSYALEQFFENGGGVAIVVRVANGARPPTLSLPAGRLHLGLVGLAAGTREYLRASVDYDGVGSNEPDRFNLVIQRVRSPGSELIEDQEIFPRLSMLKDSGRCVADVLTESRLVRVAGPLPAERPDRTLSSRHSTASGYVSSNPDGDDGAPLSDYDLIGSAVQGTGLHALRDAPHFNFLCLPPLARDVDVGAATLLVAGRFCREHHALLLVDPPAGWSTVEAALAGQRDWPFRGESAVMYFPRIVAFDRLRGRHEVFASAPASAGMLARCDESEPVWREGDAEAMLLRPGLRPACAVSEVGRARLAAVGINVLQSIRAVDRPPLAARTLATGGSGSADWKSLAARRLALLIVASLERGTRWMVFGHNGPETWVRAYMQVSQFLAALAIEGAFGTRGPEDSYFVICDERVNGPEALAAGRVSVLFGIAAARPGEFHACLVTHQAGASRARLVSVNRLATAGKRVEAEIEAAIVRLGAARPGALGRP